MLKNLEEIQHGVTLSARSNCVRGRVRPQDFVNTVMK
jgi:hypothetical protein